MILFLFFLSWNFSKEWMNDDNDIMMMMKITEAYKILLNCYFVIVSYIICGFVMHCFCFLSMKI